MEDVGMQKNLKIWVKIDWNNLTSANIRPFFLLFLILFLFYENNLFIVVWMITLILYLEQRFEVDIIEGADLINYQKLYYFKDKN